MSLFDPNNPDPIGLERLFRALPGMAHATVSKGSFKKAPPEFTRCCPICYEMFRPATLVGTGQLKAEQCNACKQSLAAGLTALTTASKRSCFVNLKEIAPGSAGTVQLVTDAEMDAFKARDMAGRIWKVLVKHCGCDAAGVVAFFQFAVENPPPFDYPLADGYVLHFSGEGMLGVTNTQGRECGDANKELLELVEE